MRAEKTVDGSGADLSQQILNLMTERWFATLLQHIHGSVTFSMRRFDLLTKGANSDIFGKTFYQSKGARMFPLKYVVEGSM